MPEWAPSQGPGINRPVIRGPFLWAEVKPGGIPIFPRTPLKRPDQEACGPPILDYTPERGV